MSDTFDHEADAWDSLSYDYYDSEEDRPRRRRRYSPSTFTADPLHYHERITFKAVLMETRQALCLQVQEGQQVLRVWVPKSICRHLDMATCTVWVHRAIYKQSKRGAIKDPADDFSVVAPPPKKPRGWFIPPLENPDD